jgi:lysine-ketoglutarate reductase/saccharopine dehydrogenase-like protein (TIGR00300 family)
MGARDAEVIDMSGEQRPKFLLCPPTYFDVAYVINPWMQGNIGRVRSKVAQEQWEGLRGVLEKHAALEFLAPEEALPDMPFVANAGLVLEDLFIPSRFRFPHREPETSRAVAWFRGRGYDVVPIGNHDSFEGEGDALFQPGEPLVWAGYGVRTSLTAYRALADITGVEFVPLRLVDERFYHLDTCFCPLPGGRVLYYPGAFEEESVALIEARVPPENRFEVSAEDALQFACNAIVADDAWISNYAGPALRARLEEWGFSVEICPLTEFMLAGGAAKCLVLNLAPDRARPAQSAPSSGISDRAVQLQGQLLDTDLMNKALDCIAEGGGTFEVREFRPGLRHDQDSRAVIQVVAPTAARLETILQRLIQYGARPVEEERDARLETVAQDGVAPPDFYSTTIYPTDIRVGGQWVRASGQRMDVMLVVRGPQDAPQVRCTLLRDLKTGDRVVCGVDGIRIHARAAEGKSREAFEFMASGVSSERRVELVVDDIAWEMRRIRERQGKIVVVAGPVVVHTGAAPYLAELIRARFVQVLLGGNAIAAHDIEYSLYGTSLGIDLKRGTSVHGGHRHHLQAINLVRGCGGIGRAVDQGVLQSGIFYECIKSGVPFSLAGSIRDDGPLPETQMDLIAAQQDHARLLEGADMILMLSSMLHAIGVGNMTPAGVRIVCVDINPAVVTKLADRGSIESTGVVTDVGLFLNLVAARLAEPSAAPAH